MRKQPQLPDNGFNEMASTRDGVALFNKNDAFIGASLRKYGAYSEGEIELFTQITPPGSVVVEVGANIGSHTVDLARLCAPGYVMAFEPQRLTFQLLCANSALNSIANIHPYQMALGTKKSTIEVPELDPNADNNFGRCNLTEKQNGPLVELRTLDSFALKQLNLLKIDVEGMELDVLKGAKKTVQTCKPIIYLENDRKDKSKALIEWLLKADYKLFWHRPPLYSPDNFAKDKENIFGQCISANMFCIHKDNEMSVTGFEPVTGPDDTWDRAK